LRSAPTVDLRECIEDSIKAFEHTARYAAVLAVLIVLLFLTSCRSTLIVAVSLSFGLISTIQPAFYQQFPADFQVIFGSSITSTVIVVFTLNLVFNHWTRRPKGESAVSVAVREGAVAVNVPDDGAKAEPQA